MKTKILIIFLSFLSLTSFSQELYYEDYDWKKTPEKYTVDDKDKEADEIMLFEKKSIEFASVKEEFYQFNLHHTIRLINTDAGIESNNKVYVNNGPGANVLVQKARVIKPNGEIINLKESDIKESKDENGEVEYRYFALEGLEKGSIIEYIHYLKQNPQISGSNLFIQSSIKKLEIEIDIISPKHLDFMIYTLNGTPEFELDESDDIRRKHLELKNIEGLEDEYQSPFNAVLKKVYFKLNKNFDNGKSNFYTFTNASKFFFDVMFEATPKGAKKKMNAIIKKVNASGAKTTEEKVRFLEHYLKTNFAVIDNNLPQLKEFDFIFEKKVTNDDGLTKLCLHILRLMEIKFELVLTSNKTERPFEEEYEDYDFLREYLIYINDIDMYWSPSLVERLGQAPYEYAENKGLFIKESVLNDVAIPIAKVRVIKGAGADYSKDIIHANVIFSDELSDPKINIERTTSGYKAIYPQNVLFLMPDDSKKKALEDYIKYIDENAEIENQKFTNDNSEVGGKLPLIASADFKGSGFTELAGDKILFKVGMLIGPQAEMYNEKERKTPCNTLFCRKYERKITIEIPENIKITNLDELNINQVTSDQKCRFISSYVLEGNKLTITVEERYDRTYFTASEYKEYETVMNKAADFNKIVLVMEKK
jgi:hypothetical protein